MRFFKHNRKIFIFSVFTLLFLFGVGVGEIILQQITPFEDEEVVNITKEEPAKEEPKTNNEVLLAPVSKDIGIVRNYYDTTLSDDQLKDALIYFEGVYRPNYGIDYGNDDKSFEVKASHSGTVTRKESDPLLGGIVSITNDSGVVTTYQSLGDIKVEKDQKVSQGMVIGTSDSNAYESDLKKHLHFELTISGKNVNPTKYFNQEITKISN